MTDIADRLRAMENDMVGPYRALTLEAADEIAVLRDIIRDALDAERMTPKWCQKARRALEPKP